MRFFGIRNVAFFVDNQKAGMDFYGKPIKTVEYLQKSAKNYNVILSVGDTFRDGISEQLSTLWIPHINYVEMRIEWDQTIPNDLLPYSAIYIFDVDNTQLATVHNSNFLEANSHFYTESQTELNKRRKILISWKMFTDEAFYLERLEKGYAVAKDCIEKKGIKIFNATRCGRLDVFERVDFDSIFE